LSSRIWFKVTGMIPAYRWLLLLLAMPPRWGDVSERYIPKCGSWLSHPARIPEFLQVFKMRMNLKEGKHRFAKLLMHKIKVEVVASLVWRGSIKSLEKQISNFRQIS
ncbi:hypothetical protein A2U01_0043317, partial [Trifolium medium]|nr:hypothetical protein [Trifolium medium]